MNDQVETTETTEATEAKSIIDPKYKGKPKKDDWLSNFIDTEAGDQVMKTKILKDEEGNQTGTEEVPTGRSVLDLDKFFALCKNNSINTAKMEEQRDRPNAPGRIRMTLGNSLRAAARKRHGLYNLEGEWIDADPMFVGDNPRVQERDGSKIKVEKPVQETDAETPPSESAEA